MNFTNANRGKAVEPSTAPAAPDRPSPEARSAGPSHQEIAKAAFGQWESHGGDADQNWLLCERRLGDRRAILAVTPSPAVPLR